MPEKGWKSVSLPEELVSELQAIVDENPSYRTVAEVVRAALRQFIAKIRNAEVAS